MRLLLNCYATATYAKHYLSVYSICGRSSWSWLILLRRQRQRFHYLGTQSNIHSLLSSVRLRTVYLCLRWKRGKASEHSDTTGPLNSISPFNGKSRIRLCFAWFPLVDMILLAAFGANQHQKSDVWCVSRRGIHIENFAWIPFPHYSVVVMAWVIPRHSSLPFV